MQTTLQQSLNPQPEAKPTKSPVNIYRHEPYVNPITEVPTTKP